MIKKAGKKDSVVLASMATKIWNIDSVSELTKEFEEMIDDPDTVCFIKFVDDNPVGFANASLRHDYVEGTETSPVGYLEGIFVEEDFRLQNIGRDLVKSCETWAKEKGCAEFASDCVLDNTESLIFHLKVGFIEANRIICFIKQI